MADTTTVLCTCATITQGNIVRNPDCPVHPAPVYDDGGGLRFRIAHGQVQASLFGDPWKDYAPVNRILQSLKNLEDAERGDPAGFAAMAEAGALRRVRGMAALVPARLPARCRCGHDLEAHADGPCDVCAFAYDTRSIGQPCDAFVGASSAPPALPDIPLRDPLHLRYEAALTVAKSALENWGRHHGWCDYLKPIREGGIAPPCTCGLAEAIRVADPCWVVAVMLATGGSSTPDTLSARLLAEQAALRAEVERLRKQHVELRHAGAALANCAYNLCQRKHLDEDERRSLAASQAIWDRTVAQHRTANIGAAFGVAPPAEGPG